MYSLALIPGKEELSRGEELNYLVVAGIVAYLLTDSVLNAYTGFLQFNNAKGYAIDIDYDVRAAMLGIFKVATDGHLLGH